MKRQVNAALVALLVSSACSSETVAPTKTILAGAPSLDVIVLGNGPVYLPRVGFQSGALEDINNQGTSVGTLRGSGVIQAVKYVAGHHVFLTPPAGNQSQAHGINDQAYVVGSFTEGLITRAVMWTPSGQAVPLVGDGSFLTGAYDINETGRIVGTIQSALGVNRAGYWDPGGRFTELVLPAGAQGSAAYAVNDNGDIVGETSFVNSQDLRPTLWRAPAYIPQLLEVPTGFVGGSLQGISNAGVMVGSVNSSPCNPACGISFKPAVWSDVSSSPTVINGADWIARDVNESGIVVGGSSAAFAWSPQTGMLSLPSTGGAGMAINDAGDAVGKDRPSAEEPTQWSVVLRLDEGDRDGDGIADDVDSCPNDRDNDRDADGYCGDVDNAPNEPNPDQADRDGDGIGDVVDACPGDAENDIDDDGVCGDLDNAPHVPNTDQADSDSDHIPDVLDACPLDSRNDEDGDDVCGDEDNAPTVPNTGQEDVDRDGVGDVADNCPAVINPDQRDEDRDGVGDACELNTPPVITQLTGPTGPIQLVAGSATAPIVVTFTDPDRGDTHKTEIDCYGNGTYLRVSECRYTQPGVYTVGATVTDASGNADTETFEYVVVYDPSAGFVTGGGWINYNGTACPVLCGNTAGRADFGFVSKYVKGATVPNGSTRFEFHAGTLQFASTTYEWLVVAGSKGQFKGRGTINGSGDYGFLLTAVDGSLDMFRIKIWDRAAGEEYPIFDTGAEILLDKINGGGSIVIHSR